MTEIHQLDIRQRVLEIIDRNHMAQAQFLAKLIQMPADNPPGDCAPHAQYAAALLEALGFFVQKHHVPEALVRERGMISATNLIICERFGNGPTIALNANGDAVKPGEGWSTDPYGAEVRDGAMFGRGAAWGKSDFATFAYALVALKTARALDRGTIELHLTYDEEVGGEIGPKWLLDQGLTRPHYAIVSGFSYSVLTSHAGCLHLEVSLRGRSAHAMAPDDGCDALEAACDVLRALYEHRNLYKNIRSQVRGIMSPTLNVGVISGGISTNVVPDLVTFCIDRRMIPEENPFEVEATIVGVIENVVARHQGIRCGIRRAMLAQPLTSLPGQERLVEIIRSNAKIVFGLDVPSQGMAIYTDARHYCAAGIPTVLYGAGPPTIAEAGVHKANEHLRLDDLLKATKVVALSLFELIATTDAPSRCV
jgi:acetylornithine deacetylase/succinyl-diaminopimelate desuccinylase-like protein